MIQHNSAPLSSTVRRTHRHITEDAALTLGESIGHGDITRADDTEAVSAAAERARADRVLRAVPGGLTGYVGHSYSDGTELSGGQWQTVGLARTLRVTLRAGTLYGALERLDADGLIGVDREEAVDGRLRRYYRLTE